MKYFFALLMAFLLSFKHSDAQQNPAKDTISVVLIKINVGFYTPFGELKDRYGEFAKLGFDLNKKTKKNYEFGISGSYIFGNMIREPDLLKSISNSSGAIIDQNGAFGETRFYMRGWNFTAQVGKLFPFKGYNPNSGLLVQLGAGFLSHKIRIEDFNRSIPQLSKEYLKGYDRLAGGVCFQQFIGYQFLSNKKKVNFYAGIEVQQAITQSLRTYNYETGLPYSGNRFDGFVGIKAGWILPLYKRTSKDFFYF